MSVFREAHSSDEGSETTSTSSESDEDVLAAIWKQFSVKYQAVHSVKLKNQFRSRRVLGQDLPALTCSLSYTRGHNGDYAAAVVKPTNPNTKWIRKIKAFPDKQTVTVYAKRRTFWGYVNIHGHAGWDWGLGKSFFGYTLDTKWENPAPVTRKFKIPQAPSLIQLRPYWNVKRHLPVVQGQIGAGHTVEPPSCHCKIPKMELVLTVGKPTNWRSIWPPNKILSGSKDKSRQRKDAWEQSLDTDSRKDQFIQSLGPMERLEYYKTHV